MSTARVLTYTNDELKLLYPKNEYAIQALGKFGAGTIIPWMRLLGIKSIIASLNTVGIAIYPVISYIEITDLDKKANFPEDLKKLRYYIVKSLAEILIACGGREITLKESEDEIIEQMRPTWEMFNKMKENGNTKQEYIEQ